MSIIHRGEERRCEERREEKGRRGEKKRRGEETYGDMMESEVEEEIKRTESDLAMKIGRDVESKWSIPEKAFLCSS